MRISSQYETVCECGADITSHSKRVKCWKCGRILQIEWPAQLLGEKQVEPKSITDKLELEDKI